jgi:anti-sigma regulatory factor (Ser/Thr protein kinase)
MTHDLQLEIRSDPRLLAAVRELVREWTSSFQLDKEQEHSVVLAIDEACSNAIRHAYGGRGDCYSKLTLRSTEDYLEFTIEDSGTPCCPEKAKKKQIERPDPEDVRPGGLGIQLIHRVFDEVDFTPGEQLGNTVRMRLNRPQRKVG